MNKKAIIIIGIIALILLIVTSIIFIPGVFKSKSNNEKLPTCNIIVTGNKARIECSKDNISECKISDEGPFIFTTTITGYVKDKNGKENKCSGTYTQPQLAPNYKEIYKCKVNPYCVGKICVC